LNLKEARNCDPEWEQWYSAYDEPTSPVIHPEQAARIKRKTDQARRDTDIEEVLNITKATPPTFGCKKNPFTVQETRQTLNTAYTTKWQFHRQTRQVAQLFGIDISNTTDHDKLTALVQSETCIMQLQNKLDTLHVHAMGDINREDFKIEWGTNDLLCTWEPFAEGRIQEILVKIEIGEDLSEEQKGHVKSLICEYADVFALSLSEVQFVDWYTHKLHIEPGETKFPTRVNQRPVTEVQKKWFNEILDDMEAAHVIQ
jgi:hypothetical protein